MTHLKKLIDELRIDALDQVIIGGSSSGSSSSSSSSSCSSSSSSSGGGCGEMHDGPMGPPPG